MKRFLPVIVVCFLLTFDAGARRRWTPPQAVSAPTYLVNQNFETATTGYDNGETWTQSEVSSKINPAYTGTVLVGTQSLRLLGDGNVSHATIYTYITFSPQTNVWVSGRFRQHVAIGSTATGKPFVVLTTSAGGSWLCGLGTDSSGNVFLVVNDAAGSNSAMALSLNTSYYFKIHLVSGGTSEGYLNSTGTFSTTDSSSNVYLTHSTTSSTAVENYLRQNTSNAAADFIFDHILISTTDPGNNP